MLWGKRETPSKIAIVTVHGTGDTAGSVDGDKWFQNGSVFARRLKERLAAGGVDADIHPHFWSGANSDRQRERAARTLTRAIRRHAKSYAGVHVIGHSHGGNVADTAASMMGWRLTKTRRPKISSITTVGTPFFKTQIGVGEVLGGIILLNMVMLVIAAFAVFFIMPALQVELRPGGAPTARAETSAYLQIFRMIAIALPFGMTAVFFAFPLTIPGLLRLLRLLRKRQSETRVFSVWHPNDEAIAFLQQVEKTPVEAFPRWSIWRSSQGLGITLGLFVLALSFATVAGLFILGLAGIRITDRHYAALGKALHFDGVAVFGGLTTMELALVTTLILVIGMSLVFGMVYAASRLLFGFTTELLGRGLLNNTVTGALRGMAFGRDGTTIGQVATQSHLYGVQPFVVDGAIADRMRAGAATSASTLIEKYRWALFSVGQDSSNALSQLATDAMTWDSLIHTTYFDQPEIADAIGDHILTEALRPTGVR